MKKYLFLSIAFSVIFTFHSGAQQGYAQHATSVGGDAQRGTLKGPAAKNQQPWKDFKAKSTMLVTQHKKVKGPAAKNNKVWKEDMKMNPVVFESREELKGPKAKNFSPERDTYQLANRRKKRCFTSNFALFNSL